jgi:ubiquinone/menaquinone biosynthesis C-methylase UbiE
MHTDSSPRAAGTKPRHGVWHRWIEDRLIHKVSYERYTTAVRKVYGGPQGALLATASLVSLHAPLGERMFRQRRFDLRGAKRILDVGSGAAQLALHLIKYADDDAQLICTDLSDQMLRRGMRRIEPRRGRRSVSYASADMLRLPFGDEQFDLVTCGYVLEHVPDAVAGLRELSRVLRPRGRVLLLATEDTLAGAWTSRLWRCQTYNRDELYRSLAQTDLRLKQELWFTELHRRMHAGGICVELEKAAASRQPSAVST